MNARSQRHPVLRPVALLLVGLLLTSCATTQLPPVSASGAGFEPEPDEVELWNESRAEEKQLREAAELYEDPVLEDYLNRVAAGLTAPGMAANPYIHHRISVVRDPTLNAFAYPHGALYIHTGLLARMENEAQLATVLGHEMSHVEYRHMVRYRRSLQNKQIALLTASIAAEILLFGEEYHQWQEGDWGEAVMVSILGDLIVGLGLQLAFLASVNGYGRDLEAEADYGGFRKLGAAGYDLAEAPRLYEILLEGGGDSGRVENFFFGSHPRLTERIANAQAYVEGQGGVAAGSEPGGAVLAAEAGDGSGAPGVPAGAATAASTEGAVGSGTWPGGRAAGNPAGTTAVASAEETAGGGTVVDEGAAPGPATAGRGGAGGESGAGDAGAVGSAFGSGSAPGTAATTSGLRGAGGAPVAAGAPRPAADDPAAEAEFRNALQPVVRDDAWMNLEAGYLALAEAHALKALDWNPEDPWSHHVLGLVRLEQARQEAERAPALAADLRTEARRAFLEAVRLDADVPDPHRELGFLLHDDGDLAGACRELGFYLDLAPDAPDALRVEDYLRDLRGNGVC